MCIRDRYRAPYGEYNNTVINAAKEGNHLAIQWNIDTLDYTGIEGIKFLYQIFQITFISSVFMISIKYEAGKCCT